MHCHLNWAFHVAQQYFFLIVFVQFPLPPPKQLFQGFVTIVHPYSFIVITMGSFPFCITRPLPISKRENRIQCTKIRLLPNPWCQNLIHPCLQLLRSFLLSQRHSHHWCSLRFTPCSCPGPIIAYLSQFMLYHWYQLRSWVQSLYVPPGSSLQQIRMFPCM